MRLKMLAFILRVVDRGYYIGKWENVLVQFSFINLECWTKLFSLWHANLIWLNLDGRRETSWCWRLSQNKQSILPGAAEPTSWEGFCIRYLGLCLQWRRTAQGGRERMEFSLIFGVQLVPCPLLVCRRSKRGSSELVNGLVLISLGEKFSLWLLLTFVQAGIR